MWKSRILSVVFTLGAFVAPASAETAIRPVPVDECKAIAAVLSKASGFPLDGSEQDAPPYPEGLRGKACWMAGGATGLTVKFDKAEDKINAAVKGLKDWVHDGALDADAPFATTKVFVNGNKRLVYTFAKEVPKGGCPDDRPIVDCKVPAKRWVWSFSASVYTQ
jgi:hypothetical protein